MALTVSGKTAIVTGAGSGINLAFAQLLLENNCNVLFADLTMRQEAQVLVNKYSQADPTSSAARAAFHRTDVTDWSQLEAMFLAAESAFNTPIDIVCPGAGVYEPAFSNFWLPPGSEQSFDSPLGSRYASLDINLTHPIRCTQLAIAHFHKHKRPGVVVHISSIAAQRPFIACPLYVAAKSGVSNFVRSLAQLETPPKETGLAPVRVVAVAPGVIKTPLWTDNPEKLAWVDAERDEWATAEEVAAAMLRLVQEPEYVGGTVLEVGKEQVRKVEVLNDPGPSGAGHTVSRWTQGYQETWERLSQDGWGQTLGGKV
ncbi:putative short chain dehydrogenase/ reductase [Microdochium trichocladiopsis]|uniref:Short chain dehydrogenase/ reductase n=1 Tax=Microdochium trichocladiopsis TaxID=1682393 RepID=A0A9P8XX14_9PEZI|nr:putative short chain dehydrogenase/ reductase [Microdochium trichocladiopsis]KAH7024377.1 putative short chain dehydrogenase/ reductase [Microdochium trichocladiopsis]